MTITSINPVTEKIITTFKESSFEEIDASLKRVKIVQKEWQNKKKEERISTIKKLKDVIEKNKDNIIATVNEECGFDKGEIEGVVFDVLDGIAHYTKEYEKKQDFNFPIDQDVFPKSTSTIKFYPLGVIAQIGIWNYPFWQTMITAIPALLAGNGIVFKPSEKATKTGMMIGELFNQILPENLFVTVLGGAKEGEYLVNSNVDAIVYTGNIETGEKIIKNAGTRPLILELSGNDAAIVCTDCDFDQTVDGVVSGAYLHSGQVCDRIKRIYVVKDIAEKFIGAITKKIKSIQVTPVIRQEALEKIHGQVQKSVKYGAEAIVGGDIEEKQGFYYQPTLLQLKDNNAPCVKEEIFGPVASILIVENEEDGIKMANSTKYGLGTSIWTQDFKKAAILADKAESGMVWINDSNIPLVCGEYFQGWKSTSIPHSGNRLTKFMKSKTIISFNSNETREWWF